MHAFIRAVVAAALVAAGSTGASAWGAIAVDDDYGDDPSNSGYALVTSAASRAEAAAEAMADCQAAGNSSCRVVLTFPRCGAYAASAQNYGIGTGNTVRQAEQRALSDCDGPGCRILVADCDEAAPN
jgi:hypothetical protein